MDPRPLISSAGPAGGVDPFLSFKRELDVRVTRAKGKLSTWKLLLDTKNTATNREFKTLNRLLSREVDGIIKQLNELERIAIKTVDRQRAKFFYIDDIELSNRKKYVATVRSSMRGMKSLMSGPEASSKIEQDKRIVLTGRQSTPVTRDTARTSTVEFFRRQEVDSGRVFEEQEKLLSSLEGGVGNIRNMAIDIGKELDEQNRVLKEFEVTTNSVDARFRLLEVGMKTLLKTNNNCFIFVVCILFISFFVETFIFFQSTP